jgi:hypothetical protein
MLSQYSNLRIQKTQILESKYDKANIKSVAAQQTYLTKAHCAN